MSSQRFRAKRGGEPTLITILLAGKDRDGYIEQYNDPRTGNHRFKADVLVDGQRQEWHFGKQAMSELQSAWHYEPPPVNAERWLVEVRQDLSKPRQVTTVTVVADQPKRFSPQARKVMAALRKKPELMAEIRELLEWTR